MGAFWGKWKNNDTLLLLLITGAVFLFLKYLVAFLSPVVLAMLFLTIFGPLLQKLQKLHLHRQIGAVLLLAVALLVLVGICWFLGYYAWKEVPRLMAQAEGWKTKLPDWADGWVDLGLKELRRSALEAEREMLGGAIRYAGKVAALGGWLVTFLIAVILLAKDYDELMNRLLAREDCHLLLSVTCGVIRHIASYVKAQGVIMTIIALTCVIVLGIARVSQGLFWGILAGTLDALPFIGTGVVLVPLALANFLEGKTGAAAACLVLYVACIFLRETLEPKLIGKKIGVRPILILISLYAGIRLFGVAGIVKGPLGFMIIWVTWQHLGRGEGKSRPQGAETA